MEDIKNQLFYSWLAGIIDGDGCFTVSLTRQHNSKTPSLSVWAQICITSREDESWYLKEIVERVGLGKLYTKKKSRVQQYSVVTYQTTSMKDGLELAKRVLPYLHLKKNKCLKFIEFVEYWVSTKSPFKTSIKRMSGVKIRTQSDMLRAVKVACDINANRQTRRYKDKLTYEQWEPLIKEWYPL